MPTLRNQKHELFAQSLAQGKSAHQSYIDAGFAPSRKNAWRLKTNQDVADRVAEIQGAAATRAEITIESICKELDSAVELAKSRGQSSALVAVAQLKNRLAGLLVDRQQVELNATVQHFDGRETIAEMVEAALETITNYRWIAVSDRDRAELAAIFERFDADLNGKLDQIRKRPLLVTGLGKGVAPEY